MSKTATASVIFALCILYSIGAYIGISIGENLDNIAQRDANNRQHNLRLQYASWVKYTGNARSLTFEEWKYLPKMPN